MNDPLVNLPKEKARALFDEMVENTKKYLKEYF
jgi:alpha-galactosidase/6-phospho-beta-glucosidase family protein